MRAPVEAVMAGLGRTPFPDIVGIRGIKDNLEMMLEATAMHREDAKKREDLAAEVALESIQSTIGSAKRQAELLLRYFEKTG